MRRKERECESRETLQDGRVNFTHLRVTSFECNKFIHMPKAAPERDEVVIGSERIHLLDTWDLYVSKNVNDQGIHVNSKNLTKSEELGRQEIQDGIKNNQWK